jgi:hypothetical protein
VDQRTGWKLAYKQLPIIEVDLNDLLLDLENYRIPTRRDDEAGALKYLFASEDVLGAARLILRDGYFDNEVPIVVSESLKSEGPPYIVLEGNRRVSALKALHDPGLVPGHESELRSLLKRYALEAQDLPDRIRVLVAPDRATAAPRVARLHTGIPKKRWTRDQQATFYYSLLDDQTTVDDVKALYPGVDIVRFIKMAVMRRAVASALFSDHSLREYAASDHLAMSVFEYAYRNQDIADAIGAKFDKDGQLLPRSSTPEKIGARLPKKKLDALEYLVNEFRAGRLNTRSLEFKKRSDSHKPFVDSLNGVVSEPEDSDTPEPPAPPVRSPSSGSSSEGGGDVSSGGAAEPPAPPATPTGKGSRGPNHPDTKDTLDLSGLDYENAPLNLKLRYFELRKISLSILPISAAILMRSILESTIKVHFESSTPVSGELSSVFKQVSQTYGQEKSLKATINNIQSGNAHKQGSIQWFNLIAHSADAAVSADDVRQAWKVVGPLLRHLLRPST